MSHVVVRYRPRADMVEENQELVEAVFAELIGADPGGIGYATFRLEDGTFVHIANVTAEENPLGSIDAFAEFQREIEDRCEPGEGPNAQRAMLVGNYGLLAD